VLFAYQSGWYGALSGTFYDVAPDDERFLVATTRPGGVNPEAQTVATANMILVENFFEELKRLTRE
jgi:hypothetical protein